MRNCDWDKSIANTSINVTRETAFIAAFALLFGGGSATSAFFFVHNMKYLSFAVKALSVLMSFALGGLFGVGAAKAGVEINKKCSKSSESCLLLV